MSHNLIVFPAYVTASPGNFLFSNSTQISIEPSDELARSSKGQSWEEYRQRLAAHAGRIQAMGVNFFRLSEVEWSNNEAAISS